MLGELEDRVVSYLQKGTAAESEVLGSVGAVLPEQLKEALPEPLKEALQPRGELGARGPLCPCAAMQQGRWLSDRRVAAAQDGVQRPRHALRSSDSWVLGRRTCCMAW